MRSRPARPGLGPSAVAQPGHALSRARAPRAEGLDQGRWSRTESNREAKFYAITKSGERELTRQAERWRRLAGLVDKLSRWKTNPWPACGACSFASSPSSSSNRAEADLAREISAHLKLLEDSFLARGMTRRTRGMPRGARSAAWNRRRSASATRDPSAGSGLVARLEARRADADQVSGPDVSRSRARGCHRRGAAYSSARTTWITPRCPSRPRPHRGHPGLETQNGGRCRAAVPAGRCRLARQHADHRTPGRCAADRAAI